MLTAYDPLMPLALENIASIDDQHVLNRKRWAELENDPFLATLEHQVETFRFGEIIMIRSSLSKMFANSLACSSSKRPT